jgi:hypothetical protein
MNIETRRPSVGAGKSARSSWLDAGSVMVAPLQWR